MRWVWIAVLVIFGAVLVASGSFEKIPIDLRDTVVENPITQIYLLNRVYDTVFEVLIFSLAVLGVSFHMSYLPAPEEIKSISDVSIRIFTRFIAFFLLVGSLYLAIEGHVSPGGGFSAGVAGGTALALIAMVEEFENFERKFERMRVHSLEKMIMALFLFLAFLILPGRNLIVLANVIVYLKVMLGSWIVVYYFIKHRGLL
ncbi:MULTISPECIES: Na(+)/H(+) antiporter subunit B [Thermotoga]|uniref:Na+/H+ antiporter MnhB subunit-related protein n=1 Tax=Thermotoga neapolitana (strain ATCC 49049 / DSM 4359 / NBRC 107923 / NS-E) TaxID=309803 RepID=B9K9K0_THENN|nr:MULTISPECIES: Na(+)/H(+) antiporter subunit B [Thermotoga]ACM23633.1 Na+/H+ antiporter MnhB subunit-related protein [Thermotoga neapolitana DSM 4359]AJG41530.1 cation:proton antiporter [Thermotoga sp. RQ7]KFZ21255.1 monovalent cation/H+ antiporter subunit B [Thermotoga neapolitana LA10]HBF10279.1 cation:proton antiporter [Thermotoga neapolitana]